MAGSTPELLTPDGDADEQRGIELAELYANHFTPEGQLRTVDEVVVEDLVEQTPAIPEQPTEESLPVYDSLSRRMLREAAAVGARGVRRRRSLVAGASQTAMRAAAAAGALAPGLRGRY